VPTGRRRPGLLFAPLRERFRCRGTSVLCFVLARAPHALGHGTVRCRAGARRRWSCGVRGPGSGGHGWRALGCTQCLVVGGRMLAGRWWWALGCTLLLAARAEYGMRVAWARVEGVTLQGFEDWTVRCRIWAGVPRSLSLTLSLSLSLSRLLTCSLSLALSLSPRAVRNGARLRRSSRKNSDASAHVSRRRGRRLQGCPPLECSVRSDELPVSMRMRMCVVM